MTYWTVLIDERAVNDINKVADYYENTQKGLGQRFSETVYGCFMVLEKIGHFQLRYKDIHCLPVKPFPFMIHYSLNRKKRTIYIHAVIHTSLDPEGNWINKN